MAIRIRVDSEVGARAFIKGRTIGFSLISGIVLVVTLRFMPKHVDKIHEILMARLGDEGQHG